MSKLPNYAQVSGFVKSSGGSRIASRVLLGASLLSGLLGVFSYIESFKAQKEIDFRKSQLKLPVYTLTEEQTVNPPWNHDNIENWLYRRGNPSNTQSRSSADPSTGWLAKFPVEGSTKMVEWLWCLSSPVKTRTTKTGTVFSSTWDGSQTGLSTHLKESALSELIGKNSSVMWAELTNSRMTLGSKEMLITRVGSSILTLIYRT